jgi:uncharacterized protein YdhG (YjbR/CyaY superfamily)
MKASSTKFKTVDEYLSAFPAGTKAILKEFRKTIRQAAPQAEELISYNIPAFTLQGRLVYYAAFKNHIGFYPVSSAIKTFQKDLSGYKTSKGNSIPDRQTNPFWLNNQDCKVQGEREFGKSKSKK